MKKTKKFLLVLMVAFFVTALSGCDADAKLTPYTNQLEQVREAFDITYNNSFDESDYDIAFTIVQNGLINLNEENLGETFYQANVLTKSNDESDRKIGQRAISKIEKVATERDKSYANEKVIESATALLVIAVVGTLVFFLTHM